MRLLRLEGEGLGGRAIDLHPEISVLTDLDDDLRERLLAACRALPDGGDPGCEGLIEAHGVLFDLGPESLALLGLDRPLDVLVVGTPEVDDQTEDGPSTTDVLEAAVAELRAVRAELDRGQLDVLAELEAARKALDPFARTAYEQQQARVDREAGLTDVEAMLAELEDPEPLGERLAELERIDRELDEVDGEAIAAALDAAVDPEPVDPEAVEAGQLAVELRQLDTELADLDGALEAQGIHPVKLAQRRDALAIDVARLESQHAPPVIDPEDREALEVAHDAVMAAQERTRSLLGGRGAEKRLEEAVEAEAAILDRIGLPTYTSFVMAVTVGSVDMELENRLHEARQELAASQSEYQDAADLLEHDPARTTLSLRRDEIVARATELLGRDPGPDVVRELLALKRQRDDADPVRSLRHRMERERLLSPGLDLDDGEVVDVAAAWIGEMVAAREQAEERAAEAEELRGRIAEVERVRAEAADRRARAEGADPSTELLAAKERFEHHEEATARVAELTELLEEVDHRRHEIEARLEAHEAVAEVTRVGGEDRAERGLERAQIDDVRELLGERLADHRDRSFAGTVPIVIEDLLGLFDLDAVSRLLDELVTLADGVQVIILDDDLPVVTWATSAGFERAAVVAPE